MSGLTYAIKRGYAEYVDAYCSGITCAIPLCRPLVREVVEYAAISCIEHASRVLESIGPMLIPLRCGGINNLEWLYFGMNCDKDGNMGIDIWAFHEPCRRATFDWMQVLVATNDQWNTCIARNLTSVLPPGSTVDYYDDMSTMLGNHYSVCAKRINHAIFGSSKWPRCVLM